jgi:dolichol-phosphate mannosyltransferase
MIKYVPDYVEVIGYRKYGSKLLGRLHRFGNWVLTKVFNLLFGTNLNDVCSGMYLVRTDIVKNLVGRARNFSIEAEIAAAASQEGNITEVPINFRERIGKRKLSTFKDGISILFNIILLSWWYNPIFVMFFLGSLLLIPGIGIALWVLYEYLFLGIKHYVWGLIAVAGGTAGLISFMLAILSLYIKRVERRIIANLKDLERRLREEE